MRRRGDSMDNQERNGLVLEDSDDECMECGGSNLVRLVLDRDAHGSVCIHVGNMERLILWLEHSSELEICLSPSRSWFSIDGRETPVDVLITDIQIRIFDLCGVEFPRRRVRDMIMYTAYHNGKDT